MLTHVVIKNRELIDAGNNNCGGGIEKNEVYRGKVEPVLVSPSESYSKLKFILVYASNTLLICLILSTSTTNYCSNEFVNNFDLRRSFYSRQYQKSYYYSPAWTCYKGLLQYRATT